MSDIITVNDLNLWYGPTQALHHVTISVPEHSITALIGPSGCGKSTTLRMIAGLEEITDGVIECKDYIKNPKPNGYRSLHLIVETPIFLHDKKRMMKVEVQFRTIAMDFWASLEHKIYYKFEGNAPEYISRELRECSGIVSVLDDKMLSLNEAILKAKAEAEHEAKS